MGRTRQIAKVKSLASAKTAENSATGKQVTGKKKPTRQYTRRAKQSQRAKKEQHLNAKREQPASAEVNLPVQVQLPIAHPTAEQEIFGASSSVSSERELSAEAERLLSGVQSQVRDDTSSALPDSSDDGTGEMIQGLMDQMAFEDQDVQDMVAEVFDWLAERFHSEHWKLSERQQRLLGKPTAQLMNGLWAKLREKIPDILTKWCEETPGATAFLMACGLVVVPRIVRQVTIMRDTKNKAMGIKVVPMPKQKPFSTEKPTRPAPGKNSGIAWDEPEGEGTNAD